MDKWFQFVSNVMLPKVVMYTTTKVKNKAVIKQYCICYYVSNIV